MEKQINNFNISPFVAKGNSKQLVICLKCNHYNVISTVNKLTYQKIKTVRCSKCNNVIKIGDIFNFKTGTKLNNRNKTYNQDVIDEHIWDNNYDKI